MTLCTTGSLATLRTGASFGAGLFFFRSLMEMSTFKRFSSMSGLSSMIFFRARSSALLTSSACRSTLPSKRGQLPGFPPCLASLKCA